MTRWRAKAEIACLFLIGIVPAEFNWYYNPRLVDSPRLFWTIDALRFILLPAALITWGIARGLFSPADLGLHMRVFGRRNPFLFIATLVAIAMIDWHLDSHLVSWAYSAFPPDPAAAPHFTYAQMIPPAGPDTGGYRLLAIFYLALGAAFAEEIFFRGLLRHLFGRSLLAVPLFIFVSAITFASVHCFGGPAKVAYALAHGLAAATLYVLTGNLWPLITGHALIDVYWFSST